MTSFFQCPCTGHQKQSLFMIHTQFLTLQYQTISAYCLYGMWPHMYKLANQKYNVHIAFNRPAQILCFPKIMCIEQRHRDNQTTADHTHQHLMLSLDCMPSTTVLASSPGSSQFFNVEKGSGSLGTRLLQCRLCMRAIVKFNCIGNLMLQTALSILQPNEKL